MRKVGRITKLYKNQTGNLKEICISHKNRTSNGHVQILMFMMCIGRNEME